eukprot:4392329-Pyramimonas_sp.AAC.1
MKQTSKKAINKQINKQTSKTNNNNNNNNHCETVPSFLLAGPSTSIFQALGTRPIFIFDRAPLGYVDIPCGSRGRVAEA